MESNLSKYLLKPITGLFIVISSICLFLDKWLDEHKINHNVLMVSNVILFIIFFISALVNMRSMKNINPNVFVRSVMATSFVKLLLLAITSAVYILNAGESRSPFAIFAAMLLYIIYTVFEKKGLGKLQVKKDGQN